MSSTCVLIIDDDSIVRSSIAAYLEDSGYNPVTAENGRVGLEMFHEQRPDIVLVDLRMPEMDGIEVITRLSTLAPQIPVVVVSGTGVLADAVEALRCGAWDYVTKPIRDMGQLERVVEQSLSKACNLRQSELYRQELEQKVQDRTRELLTAMEKQRNTLRATVQALTQVTDMRDAYTGKHQRQVCQLVRNLGIAMGLEIARVEMLELVALLHDIGKLAIPSGFLTKPSELNEYEWAFLEKHPEFGFQILQDIPFEGPVAEIVFQHHERYDGSGYPRGLEGEEILLEARLLAVADVIEAMLSHRPYRPALTVEDVRAELLSGKGGKYCPKVTQSALLLLENATCLDDLLRREHV